MPQKNIALLFVFIGYRLHINLNNSLTGVAKDAEAVVVGYKVGGHGLSFTILVSFSLPRLIFREISCPRFLVILASKSSVNPGITSTSISKSASGVSITGRRATY